MMNILVLIWFYLLSFHITLYLYLFEDHTSITNSPTIVQLHENTDREKMLWHVTGTCEITFTCHGIYTCAETHVCDSCIVTDVHNFFFIDGKYNFRVKWYVLQINMFNAESPVLRLCRVVCRVPMCRIK